MTHEDYQALTPREANPGAASRLFSFTRIRSGTATRFYPGDGTKLHYANRDVDTLEMPGVPSGYLAAGDVVTASYKGACVFRGEVATIVETRGRGTDATQTVTCVGPWSKMQRLVYRQLWFTGGGYSYSSRLILNQTKSGDAQGLDSELREIAAHGASACGYSAASADIAVSSQILPSDECRDITVADAIRRELRFFPAAICRFDYSAETPALKIVRDTAPETAAYVAAVPKSARSCSYNAHPITGVDLEIEATGTVDGIEYRQISHQTAGDTTAGNPDCLYATLQIKGASQSAVKQSFTSVTEDIPGDLNDVAWWRARHPRLANVAESAIAITEGARTPSNYPRISAATAGELEEAGLHCEVSTFTCKATITTEDDTEEDIFLTLQFLTTNAEGTAEDPKIYTWVTETSAESGETVPVGLAATILAERCGTLVSERLSIRLGDSLPVLGDAIVEPEGTVFLQSMDIDCGSLTADLDFGAPEHLSPEDMASLLSGFRNKRTTTSSYVRKAGKPKDADTVEMGAIPPLSSSEFAPGVKKLTTIKGVATESGDIRLDPSGLAPGETIGVHEIKVDYRNTPASRVKYLGSGDITLGYREIRGGSGILVAESEDGTSVTISATGQAGGGDAGGGESGGGDAGQDAGVKSINDASGKISVIGGKGIEVSTDGQTVKITCSPDKDYEDADPAAGSGCNHDEGGGEGGGVIAGGGGGYGGGGGVPADGDVHPGDDGCNCG